jgi:hypothetical protein
MIQQEAILQTKAIKRHSVFLILVIILGLLVFLGCLYLEKIAPLFCTLISNISTLITAIIAHKNVAKIKALKNEQTPRP